MCKKKFGGYRTHDSILHTFFSFHYFIAKTKRAQRYHNTICTLSPFFLFIFIESLSLSDVDVGFTPLRFLINPECLVSLFFCEMMEDNEAIVIIGAERFSNYAGYADTFTFTTNFEDDTKLDEQGRIATAVRVLRTVSERS